MHDSVVKAWPSICAEHEGRLDWLYLDSRGLVTTGVGFLLDTGDGPTDECFRLPWTDRDGSATRAQIASAWSVVKARTDLTQRGGGAFRNLTTLRLPAQAIDAQLTAKTLEFWSVLKSQLPALEAWSADAQLGLIDMAWQLGPRFLGPSWPNFTAAAHAGDFIRCAANCSVKQASAERNSHRARLFRNAALVAMDGLDPAVLWDETLPEEDEMLTDAQIAQIAEKVAALVEPAVTAAVVAQLKVQKYPTPPTPAAIAREVLNSRTSDIVEVNDKRGKVRPATALSEIHKALSRGIGTATHLP